MVVEVCCYWAKTRWHHWQVASFQFAWCAVFGLWESSPRITADTEWVTLRVPGYQDQHRTPSCCEEHVMFLTLAYSSVSPFGKPDKHCFIELTGFRFIVKQGETCWTEWRFQRVRDSFCNFSHFPSSRCCSVCFLTWSPNWFLGKFLLRLLILCLLEEIWIMAKLHHFLLCLMMFQSGVLYLRDGCRLPAKPNRQPILPALVPGRAAHCSA